MIVAKNHSLCVILERSTRSGGGCVQYNPHICAELMELLEIGKSTHAAMAVITWSQGRQQQQEEVGPSTLGVLSTQEEEGPPHNIDLDGEMYMSHLDGDLFQGGRVKNRQTRSERRRERQEHCRASGAEDMAAQLSPVERHELDLSPEELRSLQEADSTLIPRKAAAKHPATTERGFFERDGLL